MTTNVTPAVLQAGVTLTTSPTVVITGGANSQTIIKRAVFDNTTGSAVSIIVFRVPNAGSPTGSNQIISGRNIAANSTDLAPEATNMVLLGGDTIQCEASAGTAVNFFASGFVAN